MSKFKIKVSIQAFSLEVEGERADIPHLTGAIQNQLASLVTPSKGLLGDGAELSEPRDVTPPLEQSAKPNEASKPGQRRSKRVPIREAALDLVLDTESWGFPSQSWSAAQKSIWLLYVVEQQLKLTELSARQIADTFNKHCRQANPINVRNLARDLGKEKGKNTNQDTTKDPATWFLTAQGKTTAEELVKEAKQARTSGS